jgi:Zn-dependent peptidase ImmA (M78 family)
VRQIHYKSYVKACDIAFKTLIKHNVRELPVSAANICKREGIRVVSYANMSKIISKQLILDLSHQTDGFTVGGIIFYNQKCSIGRQRFTVAHELGHILLGHCDPERYNKIRFESERAYESDEHEANVFASRLLAPSCVLWGLNARCVEDIAELCNISYESAHMRWKRVLLHYEREERGRKKNDAYFLRSELERELYYLFTDYILLNRK